MNAAADEVPGDSRRERRSRPASFTPTPPRPPTPPPPPKGPAIVRQWLTEARLSPEVARNVERIAGADDVREVVVLPDVHLGRDVNNGCVAATVDLIYPQAVGGDIGCGFSALAFGSGAELLENEVNAAAVLRALRGQVPALKQRGAGELPARLRQLALSDEGLARESRRDGAYQLGTLGNGNHFVEFQRDDTGRLWLMVHSGSRGMGQHITRFHLARATPSRTGLPFLDLRGAAGQAYLNDQDWAMQYATMNRLSILARASEILAGRFRVEADEDSYLDCPHNFARREEHQGRALLVHRKSANSARAGEAGLIAGSAGTASFIVRGLGRDEALCSSSHGAGRCLSRTEARRQIPAAEMKRQLGGVYFDSRHLEDLRDEAPGAYRDIHAVLRAQRDLVRQEARLTPVLSFKYPDRRRAGAGSG